MPPLPSRAVRAIAAVFCALPVALSLAACGDPDARFSTNFASDFAPARHSVSVLGVYQGGRMNSSDWDTLGPYIGRAIGSDPCEADYNTLLIASDPLASAIDDYTREDGPTDALLTQIAPAAKGDLLLVVTVEGRVPRQLDGGAPRPSGPGPGRRGTHGGMRPRPASTDSNALEISALLFSASERRSVARVALEYTGPSVDDAMTKFAKKLGETFPQMQCAGWSRDAKLDAEQIRQSIDKEP